MVQTEIVIVATFAAILVPFVVIPEILERRGRDPRSRVVRVIVWALFLAIVLVPAAASGFLFSVRNLADWFIFVVAITVAVLYDYYRLNPDKLPRAHPRT